MAVKWLQQRLQVNRIDSLDSIEIQLYNLRRFLDESAPGTPTSPTGSHNSMALSISSGNTVPIARTDKHVVLAMSPARPKVSSMQTKLDHTKIDTSLYEKVNGTNESAIN